MDRLLTLKLDAIGCEAEAWLNGVPLARADAARPRALVPIHEYTLAGANRLELVVWPHPRTARPEEPLPPLRLVADGHTSASLRILLPRLGNGVDEASARTLAELHWAPPAGQGYTAPVTLHEDVQIPVSFPRWRWLDAPPLPAGATAALRAQAAALLEQFHGALSSGEISTYLTATRFRTEELALAYQRPAEEATARLRGLFEGLHAAGRAWQAVDAEALVLRPLAGGRLHELLGADGEPALRTEPDEQGHVQAQPLRVAAVEGRLYVLR
ncbi:MAG: hypothetical protein JO224_12715 [Pelomonas sp.]|nr:hypothetical protein [Roseateles sp.]